MKKIILVLLFLLAGCCKQKYLLQGQYDENKLMSEWAEKGMMEFKSNAKFWLKARKSIIEIEAIGENVVLEEK